MNAKRVLMLLILLAGILWDGLCIWHILPLNRFAGSALMVGGYSFVTIFLPLFFPGGARTGGTSVYLRDLTAEDAQMSYATLFLALIWLATLVACLVF
ncbi:hypothetical protein SDC9_91246 [bioreactor metagenome]|uniref:Uncharacterized protein n=1 Tax=bioreactor metagenome TaxID=1076179 RepID=A0A644ZUY0_9ZZZZ